MLRGVKLAGEIKPVDPNRSVSEAILEAGRRTDASNRALIEMIFPDVDIPAKTLIQWNGSQSLNAGDSIKGVGSGTDITVTISGVESRVGM